MKTIQWVIDSIKIEDRKVARFGKDHLTARGAAEHATYRVLGSRRDKRWLAARKLIEDALVAKEMKPMLTDGLASAKCLRSRVTLRPSMRRYAPPAQRPFGPSGTVAARAGMMELLQIIGFSSSPGWRLACSSMA
jgi:hypothetical protein